MLLAWQYEGRGKTSRKVKNSVHALSSSHLLCEDRVLVTSNPERICYYGIDCLCVVGSMRVTGTATSETTLGWYQQHDREQRIRGRSWVSLSEPPQANHPSFSPAWRLSGLESIAQYTATWSTWSSVIDRRKASYSFGRANLTWDELHPSPNMPILCP